MLEVSTMLLYKYPSPVFGYGFTMDVDTQNHKMFGRIMIGNLPLVREEMESLPSSFIHRVLPCKLWRNLLVFNKKTIRFF